MKEKLLKFDMHTHTSQISFCSTLSPVDLVGESIKAGLDGIVLTNHYTTRLLPAYSSVSSYAQRFVEEYKRTLEAAGDRLRVLFGAEVAVKYPGVAYLEFLLYGLTEDLLIKNENLLFFSQKELFEFCEKNDIFMVQSHPLRSEQGHIMADERYMHALEINGHINFLYNFSHHTKKIRQLAKNYSLKITCGSDTHYHGQVGFFGTYLPDYIKTERGLAEYLFSTDEVKIFTDDGI